MQVSKVQSTTTTTTNTISILKFGYFELNNKIFENVSNFSSQFFILFFFHFSFSFNSNESNWLNCIERLLTTMTAINCCYLLIIVFSDNLL